MGGKGREKRRGGMDDTPPAIHGSPTVVLS